MSKHNNGTIKKNPLNLNTMKNLLLISAFTIGSFFFATNNAQAQVGGTTDPAITTVNITLSDVISIIPSSAANGGEINFTYDSAESYYTIQTKTQASALKVTSTQPFDINVKAGGATFVGALGGNIPVDVLWLKPTDGSTAMGGTQTDINLTTDNQKLVTAAPIGSEVVLDIDYEIPAAKASSTDILGKAADVYTQTVIYTATVN